MLFNDNLQFKNFMLPLKPFISVKGNANPTTVGLVIVTGAGLDKVCRTSYQDNCPCALGSRVGKRLREQLHKPHIFRLVASQNYF